MGGVEVVVLVVPPAVVVVGVAPMFFIRGVIWGKPGKYCVGIVLKIGQAGKLKRGEKLHTEWELQLSSQTQY